MIDDPIATRYARALFEAAKTDRVLEPAREQMKRLAELLKAMADLRQFLWNPDVEVDDKVRLLSRALDESASPLVSTFLRLVAERGRTEHLLPMCEAFEAMVDAAAGRLHVIVRSAFPLPEAIAQRLRATLEQREGKQVDLRTELDPALLGGIQIQLDHRVIDGSVRRHVTELRERLAQVRVS